MSKKRLLYGILNSDYLDLRKVCNTYMFEKMVRFVQKFELNDSVERDFCKAEYIFLRSKLNCYSFQIKLYLDTMEIESDRKLRLYHLFDRYDKRPNRP